MQKTIIHIGPHKTGSSYLQVCFSKYRQALQTRGIFVPADWEQHGNKSHNGLVDALRDGSNLDAAAAVLARGTEAGAHTALISAEDLSDLGAIQMQRLRDLLGESQVTIVFYVRRASDMLFSAWQENVKHGLKLTLPEFFGLNLRNPEVSTMFNFEMRLRACIEVFGVDRIRIVSYSALRDGGIDLFSHFAKHFLEWPVVEPAPEPVELNVAATPPEIELLRSLNIIEALRNPEQPRNLRDRLDAARATLDVEFLFAEMAKCQSFVVLNDGFPMLHRFQKEQRLRYAANVVQPCPAEFFFRLARKEIQYIGGDYMLRPGVLDALHGIYAQVAG
jgi:hypothetical protein